MVELNAWVPYWVKTVLHAMRLSAVLMCWCCKMLNESDRSVEDFSLRTSSDWQPCLYDTQYIVNEGHCHHGDMLSTKKNMLLTGDVKSSSSPLFSGIICSIGPLTVVFYTAVVIGIATGCQWNLLSRSKVKCFFPGGLFGSIMGRPDTQFENLWNNTAETCWLWSANQSEVEKVL